MQIIPFVPQALDSQAPGGKPKKLLEQVREYMRAKHYSYRTEHTYVHWIKRYIFYNHKAHPKELGPAHIKRFLAHLAVDKQVSASTQNQAFNALMFLYREILKAEPGVLSDIPRAKGTRRLPSVLTCEETLRLLESMEGTVWLFCSLLYGTGMRVMECMRLRIKDVDFERNVVTVREGKGGKDRVTILPQILKAELSGHLHRMKLLHESGVITDLRITSLFPWR